jgi:L-alanine-DL-glutamate epimerase-like enolase superfamily enzyme
MSNSNKCGRRTEIAVPFKVDAEGYLRVPTTPGLGIELNRDNLKRLSKATRIV